MPKSQNKTLFLSIGSRDENKFYQIFVIELSLKNMFDIRENPTLNSYKLGKISFYTSVKLKIYCIL
jgi:hypothetical protein